MKKILVCIIISITMLSTFAFASFADYLGVPIDDKYDFAQSIYIDTIYSNDAWGSGTEGYISSDLKPFLASGTSDVFVQDPLTMQRYDGNTDTIKGFELNANYTRVVDRYNNDQGLIISSKHPVNNNNLSKLTYKNTKGFIADLNHDYSNMSSIMLEISDEYSQSFNAIRPSVTVRYIDKLGYERTLSTTVGIDNSALQNGIWYLTVSVLPDNISDYLKENALTYDSNGRKYCHIKSIDYNIFRETGYDLISDIQVHRYAYFVAHDAPAIFEQGDVLLIDSKRYENIVYSNGVNYGADDRNLLEWAINGASDFFNAKIFGDITLGAILVVFVALLTFKSFLKMFAGG